LEFSSTDVLGPNAVNCTALGAMHPEAFRKRFVPHKEARNNGRLTGTKRD